MHYHQFLGIVESVSFPSVLFKIKVLYNKVYQNVKSLGTYLPDFFELYDFLLGNISTYSIKAVISGWQFDNEF